MVIRLPAFCPQCGTLSLAPVLHANPNSNVDVNFVNSTTRCQRCGGIANILNGKLKIADGIVQAFLQPNMTRAKVAAAKEVAEKVQTGELSSQAALKELENISETLAKIMVGQNKIDWNLLISILALLSAFWFAYGSDEEAKRALAEANDHTEIARQALEQERQQTKLMEQEAAIRKAEASKPHPSGKNRKERRAEAAREKRKRKP